MGVGFQRLAFGGGKFYCRHWRSGTAGWRSVICTAGQRIPRSAGDGPARQ
jgi:hypothetical protein